MRIAIISDYYYPQLGGITEHVHGQATELTRRGHDVTVIAPRLVATPRTVDADDHPPETFEVVRLGRAFPIYINRSEALLTWTPRLGHDLDHLFQTRNFDVVHVHNPIGPGLPIAAVRRSPASVTVGTLHSVVPHNYPLLRACRGHLGRVLALLDACVVVSNSVTDSLGPHFPTQRFTTIPNGVDSGFFTPSAAPLPSLSGRKTILFVGRFDPRNGVAHAIGAFEVLRRTRDDVQLVIVGDGPLRPLIERLVPDELRGDVIFAGRVNRLRPRYLASADVLCSPCSLASFGMVVLEGMSCGVPVVATRLPGFAGVMRDGVDGLMVAAPDDTKAFAAALDRVLSDPGLAGRMGAAGRSRALARFDWKVVAGRIEDLYLELAGGARQPLMPCAA